MLRDPTQIYKDINNAVIRTVKMSHHEYLFKSPL